MAPGETRSVAGTQSVNVRLHVIIIPSIHIDITYTTSRPARKPTLWTLRKVLTRISLIMPRRLNRIDSFRLLWIFCFRNHYSIPLSTPETERVSPDQSVRIAQADPGRYITQMPYLAHISVRR